ncbi:AraC family transcriptional regulator [Fulvivirga sp. RKSG066]|uniref:helix-turn-helix domain-containing protein n=1 Tax=Fulvivirga aurantia TaxID=2529383 RepID=UPI0012BC9070|nr:helix-turn-helix domain-containing protein [Fulvivirga aurantia]MTI20559.1 AraC family transcriptional regulator [Fulvivirga aurantia]
MTPEIFEPGEAVADFVKCYWTLEGTKATTPSKNTIVPDGTMKLIFHYGDLYWHHPPDKDSFLQPRCFLIGQLTRPYVVEPDGDTGTFIVRFHPNGFLPFTTLPLKDMTNTPISLKMIFGQQGEKLENEILQAENTRTRIKIIEDFLLKRLKDKSIIDRIVKSAVDTIASAHGKLSIQDLTENDNINRRVLARKFSSTVGLSPKQLAKIIRLQTTLQTLLNQHASSLTNVAYENEYFDQSHFIKDFKEFTGITPKEFYGEDLKMSLIFDQKK